MNRRLYWIAAAVLALVAAGAWVILMQPADLPPDGFSRGNGRIEADLIDISPTAGGRVDEIMVREGDLVAAGDVLAVMDTAALRAQLARAEAAIASSEAAVDVAAASVAEAEARFALARSEEARAETLSSRDVVSRSNLDVTRTATSVAEAGLAAARASLRAQERAVDADRAARDEIVSRIDDATLHATGAARVLYRLAQPGEIVGPGGKILTLVSLEDVYMEIFLSAADAPRVVIGDEARIVVDIIPDLSIPAQVVFISPQAQFTPRQVETLDQRESLMFRIRVRIPPELVMQRIDYIKTGVRGVAWIRLFGTGGELQDWPPGLTPPLADRAALTTP